MLRIEGQEATEWKRLNMVDLSADELDRTVFGAFKSHELLLYHIKAVLNELIFWLTLGAAGRVELLVQNEDSNVLLRGLHTDQWHDEIDVGMHNPYVEGGTELHLGLDILDQRYDLEHIIREHQPDELLVAAKEEWERRLPFYAVLVSEISF